jgi:hypothetical protein
MSYLTSFEVLVRVYVDERRGSSLSQDVTNRARNATKTATRIGLTVDGCQEKAIRAERLRNRGGGSITRAVARYDSEPYNFPDPEACFYFASLDFAFAVFLFFKSVGAGVAMLMIASVFALVGILKKRRVMK